MRVKVYELQEGCIVSADVFSRTNRPVIGKNTVLTGQLINVLKAFLIKEIYVEKTMVNGMPFIPTESAAQGLAEEREVTGDLSFVDLFLRSKQHLKKEFVKWQSGAPIDIAKVRNILLPFLDSTETLASHILNLHHYSTKDDYIYSHSLAVGIISGFIAKKMNYSKGDIIQIAIAGSLSDCGMAKLSTKLLNKEASLTDDEYEEVKKHSTYSYNMVKASPLLKDGTKLAIVQHHERLDGSGYPFGEKDNRIHPFAKIIAVSDIFHAMTSERPYKRKHSPFKVLEMILEDYFGKFDINALKVISSAIMNFSIGSKVRLSNGQEAEVLFVEEKSPTRPLIKLLENEQIVHLSKNRQLFIEEVMH
ncbi:phosphohydrolase [Bacillus sp. T33-2]|nr:phosphohydrolase [Bacillus sp. T33-2]